MEEAVNNSGERCARCGEIGEDRRTLRMECFYDMNELGIPLEEVEIQGTIHAKIGERVIIPARDEAGYHYPGVKGSVFSEKPGEPWQLRLFQITVCKDCRADWLAAIETWFHAKKMPEGDGTIPIRKFGACRMITREEWDRREKEAQR